MLSGSFQEEKLALIHAIDLIQYVYSRLILKTETKMKVSEKIICECIIASVLGKDNPFVASAIANGILPIEIIAVLREEKIDEIFREKVLKGPDYCYWYFNEMMRALEHEMYIESEKVALGDINGKAYGVNMSRVN